VYALLLGRRHAQGGCFSGAVQQDLKQVGWVVLLLSKPSASSVTAGVNAGRAASRTHRSASPETASREPQEQTPDRATTVRSGPMHAPCRRSEQQHDKKQLPRTRCTKTNASRPQPTRLPEAFLRTMLWRSSASWSSSLSTCMSAGCGRMRDFSKL
jgi:hypothetical protein